MRLNLDYKNRRKIESALLVFAIVAGTFLVFVPISSPRAKALTHLADTAAEDWTGGPGSHPYDVNPAPFIVEWPHIPGSGVDHTINHPMGYTVLGGYTLIIPAMDNQLLAPEFTTSEIRIDPPAMSIDVYGTLETRTDASGGPDITRTKFTSNSSWDGLFFHPGSRGMIQDCKFTWHNSGLVFEPDSYMIPPGIHETEFLENGMYALRLDGVKGYTNVDSCDFDDRAFNSAQMISIQNCMVNFTNSFAISHGEGESQMYLSNAEAYVEGFIFDGDLQPGHLVEIDNNCNTTVFDACTFQTGNVGDYYVNVSGSTPLLVNCSFNTLGGQMSVLAKDDLFGVPAIAMVLNPTADGNPGFWDASFDNSTLSAMGASMVALQWYMNVHVSDPAGHDIINSPVNITAPYGYEVKLTEADGWANWSVVTEFIRVGMMTMNFNPFNVSAKNWTETGYAIPEPTMDMSKEIYIIVPFSLIPNTPPWVSWILTPPGVQSGYVMIAYILEDPDETDNGSLSIEVEYSMDNKFWFPATQGPGGDLTFGLYRNTLYYFEWDSLADIGPIRNETVYIRITPSDPGASGTSGQTGPFIVDNQAPILMSGPNAIATDTSVVITWTVHEPANATVWYGPEGTFILEATNNSATPLQSVEITGLEPGRRYEYIINSTDLGGNKYSSDPTSYTFETEIYIQLYEGWNMISLPPILTASPLHQVFDSIAGDWDIMQWYDPSDPADPWKVNNTYKPPQMSDLHDYYVTMGVWIHMKTDALLVPDHDVPDAMFPGTFIHLYPGWNFVSYPSVTERTVSDAMGFIDYNLIQTYDAATGQWYSYNGSSGDLTHMNLGHGYWIHTDSDQDWLVQYL